MGHIKVSIILVNYNTRQMTLECIESVVSKVQSCSYEIILVDNASTDGSREFFENYPGIIYIYNEDNLGFGKANNVGIEKSKGDYIFLLNTDTILRNDALKYFVEYEEQNEKNKVLGSFLRDGSLNPCSSYGSFPTIKSELNIAIDVYLRRLPLFKKKTHKIINHPKEIISTDYIVGADIFIPRKVIEECGAFDPIFFMYYEETDMQMRFSLKGYQRLIIPGPDIIHLINGSQNNNTNKDKKNIRKNTMADTSMFIYMKKYNKSFCFYLFKTAYFLLRFFPVLFMSFPYREKLTYYKVYFK